MPVISFSGLNEALVINSSGNIIDEINDYENNNPTQLAIGLGGTPTLAISSQNGFTSINGINIDRNQLTQDIAGFTVNNNGLYTTIQDVASNGNIFGLIYNALGQITELNLIDSNELNYQQFEAGSPAASPLEGIASSPFDSILNPISTDAPTPPPPPPTDAPTLTTGAPTPPPPPPISSTPTSPPTLTTDAPTPPPPPPTDAPTDAPTPPPTNNTSYFNRGEEYLDELEDCPPDNPQEEGNEFIYPGELPASLSPQNASDTLRGYPRIAEDFEDNIGHNQSSQEFANAALGFISVLNTAAVAVAGLANTTCRFAIENLSTPTSSLTSTPTSSLTSTPTSSLTSTPTSTLGDPNNEQGSNTGAIVGAVASAIALTTAAIFLYRRHQNKERAQLRQDAGAARIRNAGRLGDVQVGVTYENPAFDNATGNPPPPPTRARSSEQQGGAYATFLDLEQGRAVAAQQGGPDTDNPRYVYSESVTGEGAIDQQGYQVPRDFSATYASPGPVEGDGNYVTANQLERRGPTGAGTNDTEATAWANQRAANVIYGNPKTGGAKKEQITGLEGAATELSGAGNIATDPVGFYADPSDTRQQVTGTSSFYAEVEITQGHARPGIGPSSSTDGALSPAEEINYAVLEPNQEQVRQALSLQEGVSSRQGGSRTYQNVSGEAYENAPGGSPSSGGRGGRGSRGGRRGGRKVQDKGGRGGGNGR